MYQFLGIAGGLLAVYASIKYIQDIVRGNTKPQRAAWVIFITLSTISFFAQFAAGARASLWFPFVLMLQAIVIFVLSLKYGVGGFSKFDKISLLLSAFILIVWAATKSPALAIICSVAVNTIGKVLVAMKVYKFPKTEYLPTWVMSVVTSILTALSVGKLDWILLLPSVQNGITVGIIAWIIFYRRKLPSKIPKNTPVDIPA